MPYFNARPSSASSNTNNYGNIRAAAIASRYGKAVKDSQVHNTIRDKSEQPQNVTKAQFYPTGSRNNNSRNNSHFDPYNTHNQNIGGAQEFVKYYPKAPSFQQQIEAAEQKAHQQETQIKAEERQQSAPRREAPPQPIPRDGGVSSPTTASSGNELGENTYSKTEYHRAETSKPGPFAGNVYNSPSRAASQRRQNGNNNGALVVMTEYQDQFSQGRAAASARGGGGVRYSPRRVPVNKEIEILLQRRGLGYEYQNQKTAFEKYQERNPSSVPVTWEKPKKSQPGVILTMMPTTTTNNNNNGNTVRTRPSSAGNAAQQRRNSNNNTNNSSSTLQNSTFTHHQQTHVDRPSTASSHSGQNKNTRQQKFPPRTALTLYERSKQERSASASTRRPTSTLGVAGSNIAPTTNSRSASASRRVAGGAHDTSADRFETQPPHYLSPTREGNHTDKYHRDCSVSPKQLRHQQEQAEKRRAASAARSQQLPSVSRFDPVAASSSFEQQQQNGEEIGFYSCGCPCHAVSYHDDIIAKTMYQRVQNRRMLHTVKNFQSGSTTTGVGACLKWEDEKKEHQSAYYQTPKTYQERLAQQRVQQEQQQKLKEQQEAAAQAKKQQFQQQQQQAASVVSAELVSEGEEKE